MNLSLVLPDFASLDLTPLLYSIVLSGAIGFEREWNGRPAGLRTHILVCISSTMLILMSQDLAVSAGGEALPFDPNRMGAGIVTGIGFLGAATVLRSGDVLRGLTTAACIWFVAGLGVVLGHRNYALGTLSTIVVLFVLTVVNRLAGLIHPVVYRRLIVHHALPDVGPITAEVTRVLSSEGCRVHDLSSTHDRLGGRNELEFFVSLKNDLQAPRVTQRVAALEGVQQARWKLISVPH